MVTQLFRTVAGDFNLDGHVDQADYVVWRKYEGQSGATFAQGDANFNGTVGLDDLQLWRSNFGFARQVISGSGSSLSADAVPEPASCGLAVLGLVWMAMLRSSKWAKQLVGAKKERWLV